MKNKKIQNIISVLLQKSTIWAVLLYVSTYAQEPGFIWAKRAGGSGGDGGSSISTDALGNSIVMGYFKEMATFGSIKLTSLGDYDIFIAKYDTLGNILWAKRAGGSDYDTAMDMKIDILGNIYITGFFYGTTILGSVTLKSAGDSDIFIAKYDASGNVVWVKQAGGSDSDYGSRIIFDDFGNCIVTGSFRGTATFGTTTLKASGYYSNLFIAKYDASGNVVWVKQAGGTGNISNYGLAKDKSSNYIITGGFSGRVTFGTKTFNVKYLTDIFIAKYNKLGDLIWAKQAGGSGSDYAYDIATDSLENIIITGGFDGMPAFDGIAITSYGDKDMFIAKYNKLGGVLWVKNTGGASSDEGTAIVIDNRGNSIVAGYFKGKAKFGNFSLSSIGDSDIFITKYDASGNVVWVKQAGGTSSERLNEISFCLNGYIYVTGYFNNTAVFGTTSLISAGSTDIFMGKFSIKEVESNVNVFFHNEFPNEFRIFQNYPNPFNSSTIIEFSITESQEISITLYNLIGQPVRIIAKGFYAAGLHKVILTQGDLSSGIYYYRLQAKNQMQTNKMVLIR